MDAPRRMYADGRIAALLVVAALAGCTSATDPIGPEVDLEEVGAGPPFDAPVSLPQNDYHGAEPNVAILDDGTIFVAAMSGAAWKPGVVEGSAWLWRSKDGGDTWERLRGPYPSQAGDAPFPNPDGTFCSCDPDVVTSPDGWVYYTDWWTAGATLVGNYLVERSSDGGDTWEAVPVTIPPPGGNDGVYWVDRQWLVAGEGGFLALLYHQADTPVFGVTGVGATIKMVVSRDHGRTWGLPTTVLADSGAIWDLATHPQMLPDGAILVPVLGIGEPEDGEPFSEAPSVLRVLRSADQGSTWERKDVLELPNGVGAFWAQSAAADDAGNVLLAFNERTEDGTRLLTMESADGGATWSAPVALATAGFDALPWVAARGDGRFAVAWYSSNWTGDETDAPEDTEWFAMAAERTASGEWTAGKVDETPVWVGPMCFDGNGCGARPLRDYLSLEYAPDGDLHVAYTRGHVADQLPGLFPAAYGHVHTARVAAGSR